jgi:CheY-like chemotaxis protein
LGIGLTIVRGLTELHGGRVSATSEGFGRGAEFVVCLPAMVDTRVEPVIDRNGMLDVADGHPRRILVVEDQPALSRVTVALLEKLGHEVRAAADGPEALVAVKEYNPEVVLLDIGLPGMDGYELARRAQALRGTGRKPLLVAVTGYGLPEDRDHAFQAGFDEHLVKPVDPEALARLLAHAD